MRSYSIHTLDNVIISCIYFKTNKHPIVQYGNEFEIGTRRFTILRDLISSMRELKEVHA